jgi:putative molybdopterin biosynthesis protein
MRRAKPDFPSSTGTGEWLTTLEVATLLRVHPKHVYRLLHQGMPARRVGGQWRFSRTDIQQWADQRGGPMAATPPQSPTAASSTTILAIEPNEVADAVASVFREGAPAPVALVHTTSKRAIALLESGEVVAAIVRGDHARSLACATIRIHLGARQVGILSPPSSSSPAPPPTIAVPSDISQSNDAIACWLEPTVARGATLQPAGSALEACSRVLRRESAAAVGSRMWAERLNLSFQAVQSESWELAIRVDAMEDPNVSRICVTAQGDAMRAALSGALVEDTDKIGQMRLERGTQPGPDRHIAPGDALHLPEPAKRSRKTVRWTILTRQRADQMLGLVRTLRDRGLRVGGFVQVPSGPASDKPLGYDLYRLAHPERAPLAERIRHDQRRPSGDIFCELSFHSATLARVCEWLKEDVADSDLLIVDGVGRLEDRGQGLFPALAWIRAQDRPKLMILSSRQHHVPHVAERLSLSDKQVGELSLGAAVSPPPEVVDYILRACGKKRRSRFQSS